MNVQYVLYILIYYTHVMCFPSRKYSSFFKPIVLRKCTSSLSTYPPTQIGKILTFTHTQHINFMHTYNNEKKWKEKIVE